MRTSGPSTPVPGGIRDMVPISARPSEVEDRALPGHWEGDLLMGLGGQSSIATLVEPVSRHVMLVPLPHGRKAAHVRAALTRQVIRLPADLRRTLTWDQGKEMAERVLLGRRGHRRLLLGPAQPLATRGQ